MPGVVVYTYPTRQVVWATQYLPREVDPDVPVPGAGVLRVVVPLVVAAEGLEEEDPVAVVRGQVLRLLV